MFKILGGDFPGHSNFIVTFGKTALAWGIGGKDSSIDLNGNITSVEIVTEENKKKFLGAAGWSLAGGALLGPVGLLVGALAGGNKKEVSFAVYLKNGKKFLAKADPGTYQKIVAASMAKR